MINCLDEIPIPKHILEMLKVDFDTIEKDDRLTVIIGWDNVASHEFLSEEFMHKYKDRLDWNIVCLYQPMSMEFILDHLIYVFPDKLTVNEHVQLDNTVAENLTVAKGVALKLRNKPRRYI